MARAQSGFTLVELMIVAAIVAIIAGIAVPNLISSRATANQRIVVGSLRSVLLAQIQCQARAVSDLDRDGRGEALALDQLAGLRSLPGSTASLQPPVLAASLGAIDTNGIARSRGYLLALYLPDAAGNAVLATAANAGSIDPANAELAWSCVAWPLTRGRTGTASYFVNHEGEILFSEQATYDGPASVPPGGAALVGVGPNVLVGGTLAIGVAGADGNVWQVYR